MEVPKNKDARKNLRHLFRSLGIVAAEGVVQNDIGPESFQALMKANFTTRLGELGYTEEDFLLAANHVVVEHGGKIKVLFDHMDAVKSGLIQLSPFSSITS